MDPPDDPPLEAKVAFLSRPEAYADGTAAVEVVETHMSYVFLTGAHVYKMKKPVRYDSLDFRTLEARRRNCAEELRLNRRLARSVYLDVVPLTREGSGFALGGTGEVVDWLVKMQRLPRHLMLDRALQEGRASEADIVRAARVLATFYRDAEPVPLDAAAWRERIRRSLTATAQSLADPRYGLDPATLQEVLRASLSFLESDGWRLDGRVAQGRIVEGHGDLRPEHVCIAAEPLFIDCLEFDRELRLIDPIDELGYLALECELIGARWVAVPLLEAYGSVTGDEPDPALLRFYQARRALLRTRLSVWHLDEPLSAAARSKWIARGRRYLDSAAARLELSPRPPSTPEAGTRPR